MEDEDLLARIQNLSTALSNLSDSDEEFGENSLKEARDEVSEQDLKEEAKENELRDKIEVFFDICDDDKDGYIFDDDAEIFRDRIRQHPKESFRPLLLWLKSMPHNTIRNTSRAMFIEDVFIAFDKCHPDDPEKSIQVLDSLTKLIEESIEMEKKLPEKEMNQGHSSDTDRYSDQEELGSDSEYVEYDEAQPSSEPSEPSEPEVTTEIEVSKADPGKAVVSSEEIKKDPTREAALDLKPTKKPFKAKKRKRKDGTTTSGPTPEKFKPYIAEETKKTHPRTRSERIHQAGPREIGRAHGYKPYKPGFDRAKTTPINKRDPAERKLGPREKVSKSKIGTMHGWKPAAYESPTPSGYRRPQQHFRHRSLGPVDIGRMKGWKPAKYDPPPERRYQRPNHYRQRSLGPVDIGRLKGYKPAKYDPKVYDWDTGDRIYAERIPKIRPILDSERPRKTGPREETYPENWKPPPKEWAKACWHPYFSTGARPRSSRKKRKAKIRRAQTVSHIYQSQSSPPRAPIKKAVAYHPRAKTVDFSLANYSSEPVVIQRKKKKKEETEALKPRERAPLEGVFSDAAETPNMDDLASDPIEDEVSTKIEETVDIENDTSI